MKRASFVKRFVALVLAAAIVLPNVNWSAFRVSAAEGGKTITAAELVAKNYELTEAEANLLEAGFLVGDTYEYTLPSESGDELVKIDTDNQKINAEKYGNWVASKAVIKADGVITETVDLTKGNTYSYDGNMFTVEVTYTLNQAVPAATQKGLLEAVAYLNVSTEDIASLANASVNGNLGTIVTAMPALKQLAEGFDYIPAIDGRGEVQFGTAAQEAYAALQAQVNANSGKLKLAALNADVLDFTATEYAVKNGEAYKAEVETLYALLNAINEDEVTQNPNIADFLIMSDKEAEATQWEAMTDILAATVEQLKPVAEAEWAALDTTLFGNVNWDELDTLVAAIASTTAVADFNESLLVATDVVSANASMYNVTVNVALYTAETKDSTELTKTAAAPLVLTLAENATPADVEAAIAESGVEADAKAAWGSKYVAEGYERTATKVTANLTKDIEYVIEYKPVDCKVTFGMGYTNVDPITVPYGYDMTLPVNTEEGKAYDYTIGEVIYAQGSVYEVKGDVTVDRAAGKAYTSTDLYSIIANNFAADNEVAQQILKSGALKGNVSVSVRKPDPTDSENLLKLEDGTLTATATYPASYNELNWVPYTYGETGNENEFSGTTASWAGKTAKVQYVLELKNFDVATVDAALKLAATLKGDAKGHISTMNGLMNEYSTIEGLDDVKLAAMSGVIGSSPLVDTNGDGFVTRDDDKTTAANIVMQQYFKAIIDDLLANSLNPKTGKLKLYDILTAYDAQGLKYYYLNAETVKAEVDSLSSHLTAMMDDEAKMAALEYILVAVGYADYVEKLATVEETMAKVSEDLTLPNANIDMTDANALEKLMQALNAEEDVITGAAGIPYLVSDVLTINDSSYKMIQVLVDVNGETFTVTTPSQLIGTEITAETIAALKAEIEQKVADKLVNKYPHYECVVTGDEVVAGATIDKNLNQTYTYTAKEYTVDVAGTEQIITAEKLTIALEKHASSDYTYKYTIDGEVIDAAVKDTYTFTLQQLADLFVNDAYSITREEINLAVDKFETTFDKLNNSSDNEYQIVRDAEGNITGLNVTIVGSKNGVMSFVEELVNAGYSYIALNGQPLMYKNAAGELELSMQTMINALLADTTFGSQTLIDLGKNNGGEVLNSKLALGSSGNTSARMRSINATLDFDNLDFVLKLDGVPVKMLKVSNGLDAIKNYMSFQSAGDSMDVTLNLPEKVYEAYLTALLATGELDKTDVNAIDNKIAFEFLYDYIEQIIENEDVTATTFENTLKKLDNAVNKWTEYDVPDYNLSAYDEYYQMLREALMGKNVTIDAQPENCTFDFIGQGQSILKMLDVVGIEIPENYDTYMAMIKELKDGETLEATVKAKLANTSRDFEAALIDVRNDRFVDKADFTNDLPARLNEVTGAAVIVLLDDVDGDLTFNATTVLDLNGKTVNGSITSNKNLIIVDSSLNNDNAGKVTGAISGTATIIGGYYDDPSAEAFVKDGYKIVNKQVQNVLYTLSTDANGGLAFDINSDILEENIDRYTVFAAELAADVAVDLVANYYTTAALNVLVDDDTNQDNGFVAGWKMIYGFNFSDFVDLIQSDSIPTDLVNMGLDMVSLPDLACVANMITADLLDLDAIKAALNSNGTQAIASYSAQIAPWMVKVDHIFENGEDYLTFGITGNEDLAKSIQISLYINGDNYTDEAVKVIEYLDKIIVEENDETFFRLVDVEELTYADKHFNLAGGAKARVHLDLSDYTTAMAVIMAHGNPAKEADIIAAIGNEAALKAIFDEFTVEEVFNAVKVLNRNDSLADIAKGYGIDMEPNKYLEKALILSLSATGKVLERLEITGNEAKLGSLDQDGDGIYEYGPKSVSKSGTITKRGYGVNLDLTTAEATVIIDLFGEDCLWGDMDHDNDVDNYDATLVLQYYAKLIPVENICEKKADVNDDGAIDNYDATLILQHYAKLISKFPVEE